MYKIKLKGKTYEVDEKSDEPMMQQLVKQGAEIVAACGGAGICQTCAFKPVKGKFTDKTETEKMMDLPEGQRLSCQCRPERNRPSHISSPGAVVFTAATAGFGISTSRDVSTGNTNTAFTTDGLLNALFSLKSQYHKTATWVFHRDAVKLLRKLKDGEGRYIWNPDIKAGTPDMILGRPYKMSEYAPNTFTSGLYVGIIGDFTKYWIADALDIRVQRLNELYAANNQVGFIGKLESDGMPVLEEAFARVTLT